jgi:hypothetical protein
MLRLQTGSAHSSSFYLHLYLCPEEILALFVRGIVSLLLYEGVKGWLGEVICLGDFESCKGEESACSHPGDLFSRVELTIAADRFKYLACLSQQHVYVVTLPT